MRSIFLVLLTAFTYFSYAQGCSDAGFCTMGAMKPDQSYNKRIAFKLRSVELNGYIGTTTLTPVIYVLTADMNFGINEKTFFQLKVPYQAVRGSLGSTQGLGDLSVSLTRTLIQSAKGSVSLTAGAKIPSNNSDLVTNRTEFAEAGQPAGQLPMYYQISLGSYDAIAGASWINDKWLVATGIQIPLTENENDFRWGHFPNYPDQDYLRKYALANHLKRGTDVMLRVERNFRFTNFNFSLGVLPIYRINQDERLDFTTGERIKVDGGSGLAMSVLAGAGYNFTINHGVKLIIGKKITQREINPDGLTRHEVYSTSYVYRF